MKGLLLELNGHCQMAKKRQDHGMYDFEYEFEKARLQLTSSRHPWAHRPRVTMGPLQPCIPSILSAQDRRLRLEP